MSEDMNLSVNGQSQVPPGFRFHPTEEELLHYYLRKKVAYEKIDLDVIRDVDLNKLEPWDIQEKCKIGSTPQNDWYFFSHKDKKYPTGSRTNRATAAGFWKATGRDKVIYSSLRRIGMRKTLVFYKGRAPHGQKSDWIMHEYRLHDDPIHDVNNLGDSGAPEEGWVVCRVFKKKNYHKALESPHTSPTSLMDYSQTPHRMIGDNSTKTSPILDQILHYMGRSCKQESNGTTNNNMLCLPSINTTSFDGHHHRFLHLPRLETATPSMPSFDNNSSFNLDSSDAFEVCDQPLNNELVSETEPPATNQGSDGGRKDGLSDWATLDRLVASQLNGHDDTSKYVSCCYGDFCFSIDNDVQLSQQLRPNRPNTQSSQVNGSSDIDLWNFTRSSSSSSSDPLCHLSV